MKRELIDTAAGVLSIQAVLMQDCAVRASSSILPPASEELSVVAQHRSGSTGELEIADLATETGGTVRVAIFRFSAGVRLVDADWEGKAEGKEPPDSSIRLEISAIFGAHYRLKAGVEVEQLHEAFEEFANCNVGLHVIPYWREFVQSTCVRMGIPVIPVGMYRLPKEPLNNSPPVC